MRVLVTGGAGFIGSHICEALLKRGDQVLCLDNLSTGFEQNISHLMSNKAFTFINGDITNSETCFKVCRTIDAICHQAALGSVPRSVKNPLATHHNNATGFLNLLWAAKESDVKRFVYASSSSVYGDHTALPKVENKTGRPLSPYAVSKKTNEWYAEVFADLYNMELIGLRYFNVFGPKQSPNGAYAAVIPKFISLFTQHKEPKINGDGNQLRDFTYVDNVVQANILALDTNKSEVFSRVYNVACGEKITLNALTKYIQKILAEKDPSILSVIPKYGPEREGDIKESYADISKIQEALDYKPSVFVKEGLKKMLNVHTHSYSV